MKCPAGLSRIEPAEIKGLDFGHVHQRHGADDVVKTPPAEVEKPLVIRAIANHEFDRLLPAL